jgi:hypothetical protein
MTMNHSRKLILAPVLALALAGAGCGGSGGDENEFIDGYNTATAPLQELAGGLSGTPSQNGLTKVADSLDDVRGELAGLEPPDGAQDELDRMLAALDANSKQVRALAKAVKSGDVDKLTAATKEYSTAGNELVAAEDALRKAVEG